MLGQATQVADFTVTSAAFVTVDDGGAPAIPLATAFAVEEKVMLVDLEVDLPLSHAALAGEVDVTLLLTNPDGSTTVLGGADGLGRHVDYAGGTIGHFYLSRTLKLAEGDYKVEAQVKSAAGALTVAAATFPAELRARRHSHPGALAHHTASKVTTGTY